MLFTINYYTNRKNPRIEWFFDSLHRELGGNYSTIRINVIDYYADNPERREAFKKMAYCPITHTTPKPCVWQGNGRLTKQDYFAAANARNTGLCLSHDGYFVCVDDLSVLLPGWWNAVTRSVFGNYIVLGSYKKVKNLIVDKGEVKSFEEFPSGVDSRWNIGKDNEAVETPGQHMFGCSFAGPTSAFLNVGGFPELCDGMGSEDYIMGIALQKSGCLFKYDRRMLTYESEEAHFEDAPFKRVDKGVSPNDKSHAALNFVLNGMKYFENYVEGGIPGLRKRVLNGEKFPPCTIPEHCWFSGESLKDW